MPIIPRFASVQDPNTPPNVDFSQGIMQSALAGAQLRRMGVEEKQAEAEGKRADARLGMQQDSLAFRKQAYQDSRDAQSEQAAVTGFFSGQSGLPADQAGPPSPFEAQELETRGAQAFRGSLKTPEAQMLFDQQYAGYLQNRQSEVRAQALQSKLQDTLMGAQQLPGAQPFLKSLEALGAQLDTIADPNLDPNARNNAMAKWSDDFQKIEDGIRKEQKRLEDTQAATEVFAAKIASLPVGHPNRSRYQDIQTSLALGGDPAKAVEAMYSIDQGLVQDKASGAWMKPEAAIKVENDRARLAAMENRVKSEAASGKQPKWNDITNYAKFLYDSQYYTDKETGQPTLLSPSTRPLTPQQCQALAFAEMNPEAFAERMAESAAMDAAIAAEEQAASGAAPAAASEQTQAQAGPPPAPVDPALQLNEAAMTSPEAMLAEGARWSKASREAKAKAEAEQRAKNAKDLQRTAFGNPNRIRR